MPTDTHPAPLSAAIAAEREAEESFHEYGKTMQEFNDRKAAWRAARAATDEAVKAVEGLRGIADELASLLQVQPPMRRPYLQGCHGVDVVERAVSAIRAACSEHVETTTGGASDE